MPSPRATNQMATKTTKIDSQDTQNARIKKRGRFSQMPNASRPRWIQRFTRLSTPAAGCGPAPAMPAIGKVPPAGSDNPSQVAGGPKVNTESGRTVMKALRLIRRSRMTDARPTARLLVKCINPTKRTVSPPIVEGRKLETYAPVKTILTVVQKETRIFGACSKIYQRTALASMPHRYNSKARGNNQKGRCCR